MSRAVDVDEKLKQIVALGQEIQSIDASVASAKQKRNELIAQIGPVLGEFLGFAIYELYSESRFDRFVQAAMQGLLASGRVDPHVVPQMAVEIAKHTIALSEEFPELDDGTGTGS